MCVCDFLPSFEPRTRVVFLQHPREKRVAISTCRMAHVALSGSELYHGVDFSGHAAVEALCAGAGGDVAVLFPGEGTINPRSLPPGRLRTLVVVDGTWSQARKLIERNRLLAGLPRLGLVPAQPGNYRIRREPAAHCLSTIEAVVEVLGVLEGDPDLYRTALRAFDRMVDIQIERRASRIGPGRHKRRRTRMPRRPAWPRELLEGYPRAVVIYAEANAGATPDGRLPRPELLQLLASRPATGERFSALVRPRRALGDAVPWQLEMPASRFAQGESVDDALVRFAEFLNAGDLLCGWGRFAYDLWRVETDDPERPFFDLRVETSKRLGRRSGGIEQAGRSLDCPPERAWAEGRGGRRIAALEAIFGALTRGIKAA